MPNSRSGYASLVAALTSVILTFPAEAQQSDAMNACLGRGGVTVDQRFAACTSVIDARTESNENLALAYGNRGVASAQRKETENARSDYGASIRLDSASAASHRFRGNIFLLDADERKASEEFREAIKIDPRLGPAYANLGIMALRGGSASSAIEYLDKSIEYDPDNLGAYQARGSAEIQLDRFDQAIADFTKTLKGQESAEALFGRGSAYAHKGDHEKALADYDEGLRLMSHNGIALAIRCAIRAVLGQPFGEVMEDCDKAMALSNSGQMRAMRGAALLKFDKPDRALKEFDIALRLTPKPAESQAMVLYGRGLARRRLGDKEGSAKDVDTAVKLSPRAKQRFATFFRIED